MLVIFQRSTRGRWAASRASTPWVQAYLLVTEVAHESDERQIREVHSTWIDPVNAGDPARLLTLVTDDVVFLNPGQAPFGRAEFSAYFSAAQRQVRVNCISQLEDVVVASEVAYTRSRDALSVTPHGGSDATQLAGYRMRIASFCISPVVRDSM
jgi:uncharacterized protein (TIGR02246 family)